MKKQSFERTVKYAEEELDETLEAYEKASWLNPVTLDDVLEAEQRVVKAKRLRRQNNEFSRSS